MWNFLGGLAGGAMNLIGGLFGQHNQAAINQQNIAEANTMAQNAIQWRVADARKAGINPLAALGSSFSPSAPQLVGSDALPNAMSAAGQNLSRAAQAYGDSVSKAAQLDNDLKEAQIAQIKASTVDTLARASKLAQAAMPGSPPTQPFDWRFGGPVDPRPHRGMKNLTELVYDPATGRTIELLTPEASQQTMTSASLATNAAVNARMLGGMVNRSGEALGEDLPVRPDLGRIWSTDNSWLWQQ